MHHVDMCYENVWLIFRTSFDPMRTSILDQSKPVSQVSASVCLNGSHKSIKHTHTHKNLTYFVSRWEVLQSLLRVPKFICIHLSCQSKTWSVNHSVTPLRGGQKTPAAVSRIWQSWDEVPDIKSHAELPVKLYIESSWLSCLTRESFQVAIVWRYSPVAHSFMPIQIEGRCGRWGKLRGFFSAGLRSQKRWAHRFPF